MLRMYELLVRPTQAEDVARHDKEGAGQLLQGMGKAAGGVAGGNGGHKGDAEQQEKYPPGDAPRPAVAGDEQGEQGGEAQQEQAGDGELLIEFVAEVPVVGRECLAEVFGEDTAVVELGGEPAAALTGEVVGILHLLVEHVGIGQVVEALALIEQGELQLAVETADCLDFLHRAVEKGVAECHAGANEGGGKAEAGVAETEDGVVDFFADGIEQRHVVVNVLGYAVGLHNLHGGIGTVEVVDVVQVVEGDDVVGI